MRAYIHKPKFEYTAVIPGIRTTALATIRDFDKVTHRLSVAFTNPETVAELQREISEKTGRAHPVTGVVKVPYRYGRYEATFLFDDGSRATSFDATTGAECVLDLRCDRVSDFAPLVWVLETCTLTNTRA